MCHFILQNKNAIKAAEEVLAIVDNLLKSHNNVEKITRRRNATLTSKS